MKGYFNNPEATREMFTDDGYLRTGDLGYFDRDGYLYITGRSKNLIVTSGGKNVYPEEIEQYFDESPEIGEIMVIGEKESALGGERVAAVVHPDYEYLEEEYGENGKNEGFVSNLIAGIIKKVNSKLPGYKKIDRWIIRTKEFEKTSSKKIKRYLYKNPDDAEV
jgi:long-chain acyl-CoA synthetase